MATHAEVSRFQRRFRQVATAVGLLVLLALVVLIWREYRLQIGRELAVRGAAARERLVAVEGVARAADVHVKALRFAFEAALGAPLVRAPAMPALPAMPAAGGPPVDIFGPPRADETARWGLVMASPESLPRLASGDREFAAVPDLFLTAAAAQQAQPFLRWSYYFSARRDMVAILPWATLATLVGAEDQRRIFDGYFTYPVYTLTEEARNPERKAIWTPAYFDAGNAGLMVSHAAPVDHEGQQIGMVGTDVLVSVLSELLWMGEGAEGLYVVAEPDGTLVADSRRSAARASQLTKSSTLLPVTLGAVTPGLFQASGDWYVLTLPVSGTPWRFASAVPWTVMQGSALRQILPYVLYLLLLGTVLTAVFAFIGRRFIAPAFTLAATVERLALDRGTSDAPAVPAPWRPWIARLHEAFRLSREAEEQLRQAERKASAIINVALEAVVTADEEGRIVDFNPAAEAMFGRPAASARGRTVGEIIVPAHLRARHEHGMAREERTGGHALGRRLQLEALHAGGGIFPIEIQIHKLDVPGVRYAAYIRDLTSQKAAEAELVESQAKLHQAEKLTAMGSLLAGVAHEINNPLAIAVAQAGLLEEVSDEPDTRATAARIKAAATRCARIVKTFLSMARRQTPQRERVPLTEVIGNSTGVVGYSMRSNGVELTLDLADGLPDVEGDPDQLGQVFSNLLLNAQQAMDGLETRREVRVAAREETDGFVEVVIADSGPGIPADVLPRIFEAFFTTKPAGLGTGIGLAICRNVVMAHGGTIEASNAPEGGAVFRIRLPALAAARAVAAVGSEDDGPAAGFGGEGLRVLVVDDEAEVAAALAALLRRDGHAVETRAGVEDGLSAVAEHGFDVAFCDVRMPAGGGAAFLAGVSRMRPALAERVIFVTGDMVDGPGHMRRNFPGRAITVLEKPFSSADVRRAVEEAAGFA